MSKTTGLVGGLCAFGALAYLMAPLPPETERGGAAVPVSAPAPSPAVQPASIIHPVTVARVSPAAPVPLPADATTRLVLQIQTELLRLGCYDGAVDGRWSAETQQAMHALGERVRVLRPVDTPDYIMLALARRQASHTCLPQDRATASRQPARIVHLAGPWEGTADRSRAAAPVRRQAERTTAGDVRPKVSSSADRRVSTTGGASAERTSVSQTEDLPPPRERGDFDGSRMGLGAAAVDPLARPQLERSAADQPPPVAQPPRRAPRVTSEVRPASRSAARNEWRRNIFNKMRFDGP